MKRQEKMGAIVLVGLLSILAIVLFFSTTRPSGPGRGFDNNVIVQQRVINLNKSK